MTTNIERNAGSARMAIVMDRMKIYFRLTIGLRRRRRRVGRTWRLPLSGKDSSAFEKKN